MRLSEMLRLYIAANKLEQKSVAEDIGISESSLSRFLSETIIPDAVGFMRIVAWSVGVSMPKDSDIERRLTALEIQMDSDDAALQAASRFLPIVCRSWNEHRKIIHCLNCLSQASEDKWKSLSTELQEALKKINELESNERAYEKIIGPCSYQEVADELHDLRKAKESLDWVLVNWIKPTVAAEMILRSRPTAERDGG